MRSILPKELMNPILLLFGFGIGLGHIIIYLMNLLNESNVDYAAPLLVALLLPILFSLIQILLSFFFFRNESPLFLFEHQDQEEAIFELSKIYTTAERRIKENKELSNTIGIIRSQYPSYSELLTEEYRSSTFKGIFAVVLRNFVGGYSMAMIVALLENNKTQKTISIVTDTISTLVCVAPSFYINSISLIHNRNWT